MEDKIDYIAQIGSERNILSIVFLNNSKIIDVETAGVTTSDFTVKGHKVVFQAMLYLFSKNLKIDPMTINEVLSDKAKEALDELNGIEYLTILSQSYVSVQNLPLYIKKVKQAKARRNLYRACKDELEFLLSEDSEILNESELYEHIENKITQFEEDIQVSTDNKIGTGLEERLKARMENPIPTPGITFGNEFKKFNDYTGGARPGDCIVICARAKTGKSQLLRKLAENISIKDNYPVLYIDTEMDTPEQEDRMLACLSGIPIREIETGLFGVDTSVGKAEDKIAKLNEAKDMINKGNFYHIYAPTFTAEYLKSIIKKYRIKYNIQAVFFDYIKMPSTSKGELKSQQEWQALGYVTTALKEIAGEMKIPVITACQENRNNANGMEKDVTNIGGSDRITQYATKIIFLYNKTDEAIAKEGVDKGTKQLKIAVQRNGMSDPPPINLHFDGNTANIFEVSDNLW